MHLKQSMDRARRARVHTLLWPHKVHIKFTQTIFVDTALNVPRWQYKNQVAEIFNTWKRYYLQSKWWKQFQAVKKVSVENFGEWQAQHSSWLKHFSLEQGSWAEASVCFSGDCSQTTGQTAGLTTMVCGTTAAPGARNIPRPLHKVTCETVVIVVVVVVLHLLLIIIT